jgi:membrane peptidoglycan carboxypeptidase
MSRKGWPRRLLRAFAWTAPLALLVLVAAAIPAGLVARDWAAEGEALADAHAAYEVAHPGWSFPARVHTRPTAMTAAPKRLVAEAKARGYVENCPTPGPGELCAKSQLVVPRSGDSLEPIELGILIGPDAELRWHLPLAEAPEVLLQAIVAAEDREYWEHHGVNLRSMARAVLANAQEGGYAQGGSTLTMQVVRNLNQRREKTVSRKLQEMVMAWAIDRHLGKEGVLQMYLDAPYLGQRGSLSVCGFDAASWHYFGHSARTLSQSEAATLAGILPAPGRFAPDRFPDRALERRDRVLLAMQELYGVDATAALAEPIQTTSPPELVERYPAYLSATRAWLEAHVSPTTLYGAGLRIEVGLDVVAQEEAESMFPAKIRYFEQLIPRRRPDASLQAAGVLLDVDTGLMRAVYGGSDVTAISFNRATQALRQPGSSFKPLTYAMAFELRDAEGKPRFTAGSAEPNSPRDFLTPQGKWRPRNVGGEYTSTAALAHALTWSQNIATASLLEEAGGPKALTAFASRLGFDTRAFPEEMGLSLGQGEVTPLAMAQFAGVVSNGGLKLDASPVTGAWDAAGVMRVEPPRAGDQVIDPMAALLTRELMRSVIDTGTGGASRGAGGEGGYQGPALGKTGTTDGEKDLWFVGATPRVAMAVWIGYDVPSPLGLAASDLAAPLWGWWMNRSTRTDLTERNPATGAPVYPAWPEESLLERRWICKVSGKLMNGGCPGIGAPFEKGTAPRESCPIKHEPISEDVPLGPDGKPKPKHESVWKKMQREQEEAAAAAAP